MSKPTRGVWGATYCEGYEAFWAGASLKDCPYPDTDEKVGGTVSLTCRSLRHDWIEGWEIATEEFGDGS